MGAGNNLRRKSRQCLRQDLRANRAKELIIGGDPTYNADEEYGGPCLEGESRGRKCIISGRRS